MAFTLNMIGILIAGLRKWPYAENHGPAFALGNFVAAVACRNEFFLRYLFWVIVKIFQKVCAWVCLLKVKSHTNMI